MMYLMTPPFIPYPTPSRVTLQKEMGIYRRSRTHKARKDISKKYRTRRRTKDLDQVVAQLEGGHRQEYDEDLPGAGQHECVECSRFFIDEPALKVHVKSKQHKKRLRELKNKPFTLEEAMAAGGCGSNDFYSKNPHLAI
jgi:bud site selection protein 20